MDIVGQWKTSRVHPLQHERQVHEKAYTVFLVGLNEDNLSWRIKFEENIYNWTELQIPKSNFLSIKSLTNKGYKMGNVRISENDDIILDIFHIEKV